MGLITTSIPAVGQPNSTEDPKVASDITTITTVVNGNLDLANLSPALQAIVPGTWTTYTPAWTGSIAPPVLGNGTLAGSYQTFNKTCLFRIKLTVGSTTSGGEGLLAFSLPTGITATDVGIPLGSCLMSSSFLGMNFAGLVICGVVPTVFTYVPFSGSSTAMSQLINADVTGGPNTGWPTTPGGYPLSTGSSLALSGCYRTT